MKKEELLNIGLTEEQADKVFAMNGKDIEKHKKAAEDAKADKDALEQQVADRDKDIAELKKPAATLPKFRKSWTSCRASTTRKPKRTRHSWPSGIIRPPLIRRLPTAA